MGNTVRNKIKIIFTYWLFTLYSCASYSDEQVVKINEPLLVKILALSEVMDLNQLQKDVEKNLLVKVYKLPGSEENDCFPELHGICKYKYYLATSQLDDSPIINAYYLGELGEITAYTWAATNEIDTATINIRASKYTREALDYNRSLKNVETSYKLIAKPDQIQLVKMK